MLSVWEKVKEPREFTQARGEQASQRKPSWCRYGLLPTTHLHFFDFIDPLTSSSTETSCHTVAKELGLPGKLGQGTQ